MLLPPSKFLFVLTFQLLSSQPTFDCFLIDHIDLPCVSQSINQSFVSAYFVGIFIHTYAWLTRLASLWLVLTHFAIYSYTTLNKRKIHVFTTQWGELGLQGSVVSATPMVMVYNHCVRFSIVWSKTCVKYEEQPICSKFCCGIC